MRALPGRSSRSSPDTPPAAVTRSGAAADQRHRILRATAEVVAERGYSELTVELIVKRAHCSFKTFYKHFAGKEDCFIALFESALKSTEMIIAKRLAADPLSWPERVVLALRTLFELIISEPAISRAVIVESRVLGPAVGERYEQASKALVPLFHAGRGLSPRGTEIPATIEHTLAGAVFWSAYQRLVVGEVDQLAGDLPALLELVLRTYLGQAEAAHIVRDGAAAREPVAA